MRPSVQIIIAGLISAVVASPATADDGRPPMRLPQITATDIDWDAARKVSLDFIASASDDDKINPLAKLNTETGKVFAQIETSPVPVLLPFDTAAYARDIAQGSAADNRKYLSGFAPALFFPGPSGYDAVLTMRPDAPGLGLTYAKPVNVEITGAAFVYELDGPSPAVGEAVPQLEAQFPGIRRSLIESHLHYTFVRFGAPYAVSIACFDGPAGSRRLSCREADKVALRFLQALNLAGGAPETWAGSLTPRTIDRPEQVSSDFTYFAAGDLIPGTGVHGKSGVADDTVYAKLRFPIAQPPDFAVSQSFMNWGNCDLTGRVSSGSGYHCRVNYKPLVNDEAKNFAYPWRDNFCEHRTYEVSQCPGGMGHQGQDIRPSFCFERDPAAGRCEPYQEDVVAVSDGVLIRDRGDLALYLLVDKPGEHIRVRYLHMSPQMLDATGMVTGRHVVEGEVLGSVGSFGESERGTSYHLHFDAQIPTRAGWVFINPYMTLVGAYERLIGGRGQVVNDAMFAPPSAVTAAPAPSDGVTTSPATEALKAAETPKLVAPGAIVATEPESPAHKPAKIASNDKSAEHCTTVVHRGHRRRVCSGDDTEAHERESRHVRSVDSSVPEQGRRTRHHGRYVHERHGGDSS
jgi:murein DD-endopeptidase MepM/ murein hydrolase activator NlpD